MDTPMWRTIKLLASDIDEAAQDLFALGIRRWM